MQRECNRFDRRREGLWPRAWNWVYVLSWICVPAAMAFLCYLMLMYQPEPDLGQAAYEGQLDVLRAARMSGRRLDVRDDFSPLSMAAAKGDVQVLSFLLDAGVDVNAVTPNHGTALQRTLALGNFEAARLLIRHGASLQAGSPSVPSTLESAAMGLNVDCVRLVLDAGCDPRAGFNVCNPLTYAMGAAHEAFPVMELLLESGVDPNGRDRGGRFPLLNALTIIDERVPTARLLLEWGADPDLASPEGLTARAVAQSLHEPELSALFERYPKAHAQFTPVRQRAAA